ncbi:ectoine/hydroxyectoine ABC transporter substrate-binding protein EhuB [Streptomyces thermolilacinus]|uniref:Ectoine/hydroxyectoine ABC transporter substrate-binding protein EhuB n=1 Tax=Streptomyces thermolilacinus SPC6 TaxID=1306406 RepID=A0A1D3DUY6_9ACTN|nr:ectoine/hydroxyectoine ABC transporter substrate-binding protein EhuB [Streptomyces thermolilacinus]OEJ96126.1 ectoine/hydroxyectoine ABC transporter substrate-binding protein EhuB [Streptomyces thermolilacinus SPC6]
MARTARRTDNRDRESGSVRRRSLLLGTAAFGVSGALGAAGCARVPTGDALARLRSQGTVRLGIAGEVPYGYVDEDGAFTGEAPELAKVVFRRLGIDRVQPVATDFGSLIPGLNSQQFDVVSAGMYIKKDRCRQVLFSDPEYQMLDSFIVRKGNPLGLRSYEDVVRRRARLATGAGYAQSAYAVAAGYPEKRLVILQDQVAGLNAVESGRVDAFVGTALTSRQVVRGSARTEATEPFAAVVDGKRQIDGGGFAFRRTDRELRDAFNAEIHRMKRSGELFRIMRRFGFTRAEMTTLTAEELCR